MYIAEIYVGNYNGERAIGEPELVHLIVIDLFEIPFVLVLAILLQSEYSKNTANLSTSFRFRWISNVHGGSACSKKSQKIESQNQLATG